MRRVSLISERIADHRYSDDLQQSAPAVSSPVIQQPTQSTPTKRPGMGDIGLDPDTVAEMQMPVADGKQSTAARHLVQGQDGNWAFSPERQKLHDQIVQKWLANGDDGQTPVERHREDHPMYNVLGGGPAAGKSTMVNAGALAGVAGNNPVMVNADEMKGELPEYQALTNSKDPIAAPLAHEESSYLAKRLQAAAFENGYNVTLDGTGDTSVKSMSKKIGNARNAGYGVNGFYVTVPTDMAVQRAQDRQLKTGRGVPESIIRGTHASVSHVLPQITDQFDNLHVYDSSGPQLQPIFQKAGGKSQVQHPQLWQSFLNKANEPTGRR